MIKQNQIIKYKKQLGKIVHCYGDKETILRFRSVNNKGSYYPKELEIIDLKFVEEASFKAKIDYIERRCPWGRVVKTHCISNIQIVEYHDDKANETGYSIYIDFDSTSIGASTLDTAILSGICKKYKESAAVCYIAKMLNMPLED